jgi:hypothetical protein
MIVVASENTTLQGLRLTLSFRFGCSEDALKRLRFHPELKTIQVQPSPYSHEQEQLHAAEELIESCPLMNNICFVQCDFTAQTWMHIFAALCQVHAPEVNLGLIDCKLDDEAANQLKILLHKCPKTVHLFTNASQDWFPPSEPSQLLPLLGPSVCCLQILLVHYDSNYRFNLMFNWDHGQAIMETMNFLGNSTNNLAVQELRFYIDFQHANLFGILVSRIPYMYGVERLVIEPRTTVGLFTNWQAYEEKKQYLLRALDRNFTIQKFEITGYPFWSDHDITSSNLYGIAIHASPVGSQHHHHRPCRQIRFPVLVFGLICCFVSWKSLRYKQRSFTMHSEH